MNTAGTMGLTATHIGQIKNYMNKIIAYSLLTILVLISFNANSQKKHPMTTHDFTTTLVVDQTPAEVFKAIQNVRGWWSEEIEGGTSKLNDVFTYHFQDVHRCKMKLVEVVPNKKMVWLVLENHFNFTNDSSEWIGNKVVFDISRKGNKTSLHFTQIGLVPEYECYTICHDAWTKYIQTSLRDLIVTGKGEPNGKEKPQTADEKRLSGK